MPNKNAGWIKDYPPIETLGHDTVRAHVASKIHAILGVFINPHPLNIGGGLRIHRIRSTRFGIGLDVRNEAGDAVTITISVK